MNNILITTILREKGTTGVQTHFNELFNLYLDDHRFKLDAVTPFSHFKFISFPIFGIRKLLPEKKFKFISIFWYRYWHYVFLFVSLLVEILRKKPIIINAQCPLSAKAAITLKNFFNFKYKIFLTVHFNESQAKEFSILGYVSENSFYFHKIKSLEKRVLNNSDRIIFVSKYMKKLLEKEHNLDVGKSVLIHNWVRKVSEEDYYKRYYLNLNDNDFVLMNVGTLEKRKNQIFLIYILKDLKEHFSNIKLVLIGGGVCYAEYKKFICNYSLNKNILLLGNKKDAWRYLKVADVYLCSSFSENLPISLIEATRASLPIISFNVGGISEIVFNNYNGYLCKKNDKVEFMSKLVSLVHDENKRNFFAINSFKVYKEYFSNEYAKKHFDELFKVTF